jgi:hypothetical protein
MTIDCIYKKLLQQKEQRGVIRGEQENKNKKRRRKSRINKERAGRTV